MLLWSLIFREAARPHPFLKSSSILDSVSCFCWRLFWFLSYNNVDVTIPVRCILKMLEFWSAVFFLLLWRWVSQRFWVGAQKEATFYQLKRVPSLFSLSSEIWASTDDVQRKQYRPKSLSCTPTCWIFESECFYGDSAGVPCRVPLFSGEPNMTGGQETQTHLPIWARPEYDLTNPWAYYHTKDLWYARRWANYWWVCDHAHSNGKNVTVKSLKSAYYR